MHRSRLRDEDALARTAGELCELESLPDFRVGLLTQLRELVGCDVASYNEIGKAPGEAFVIADPMETLELGAREGLFERFAELVPRQNPLASHFLCTGEQQALRLSDFISRRELHALELYDILYRHLGTEHQLAFTVPAGEQLIGVTLSRGSSDFDAHELALLEAARTIALPIQRNLQDRARLDAVTRALNDDLGPFAIFCVSPSGAPQPAHERAARLLRSLSRDRTAHDTLLSWTRLQHRRRGRDAPTLRLATERGTFEGRYLYGPPESIDTVTLRALARTPTQALCALGLTRRQADVLQVACQGATNANIALALSISEHTVRHHLEEIYRRLGVGSRAAAVHSATQALLSADSWI